MILSLTTGKLISREDMQFLVPRSRLRGETRRALRRHRRVGLNCRVCAAWESVGSYRCWLPWSAFAGNQGIHSQRGGRKRFAIGRTWPSADGTLSIPVSAADCRRKSTRCEAEEDLLRRYLFPAMRLPKFSAEHLRRTGQSAKRRGQSAGAMTCIGRHGSAGNRLALCSPSRMLPISTAAPASAVTE